MSCENSNYKEHEDSVWHRMFYPFHTRLISSQYYYGAFFVMTEQPHYERTKVCKHLNPFGWLNKFNICVTPHSTVPVPGLLSGAPDLWVSFKIA